MAVTTSPAAMAEEWRDKDWRDEDGELLPAVVSLVRSILRADDRDSLKSLVSEAHEADLGALLVQLDGEDRGRVVSLLGAAFDFNALNEVDETIRSEILEDMAPATVAEGISTLETDDAVAILEDLDEDDRTAILDELSAADSFALRRALDYPEGSAGRRMKDEFIAVPPFWTVGQIIDHLREAADLPDDFTEVFIVDPGFHLQGHIRLDRLLRTKRPVPVTDILEEEMHTVGALEDQEDAALLFERYNLLSAPVVDEANRLVGVLTVDDIVDVIEEEADEDIKALGGVKADEEISDSVWTTAKSRFRWLLINLVTAFLATTVLKSFEHQLETMVALAVLAPIVASQGGSAATQTMTVAVRALATRALGPRNAWRVVRREVLVGLFNGIAFALITGTVASFWFTSASIGMVIGLALVCNLVAGSLGGVLVPLALDRMKVDPAIASGPFVTTVTDVTGFFSFLMIATWWFRL